VMPIQTTIEFMILKLKREENVKSEATSTLPEFLLLERELVNQDCGNEYSESTDSVDLAKKLRASWQTTNNIKIFIS